jgi:hypothetical protein
VTDLLLLAVALATAAATGLLVLRVAAALPAPADRLLPATGLGLGVLGVVGLALAAAGLLRPLAVATTGLVLLSAGARDLIVALRAVRAPRGALAWALVAVCAAFALTQLPPALAPAVGGDQTKYQLAYPRLYALAGGLVATPWTFWGQQQFLQNFLYAATFALHGDVLPRLLNAADAALVALAAAALVRRHLAPGLGAVAGALVFTLPMTWTIATRAGSDLALVLPTFLAVDALLAWARSGEGADLRRTALLAGVAGGTKVLGLLVPFLAGLGVLGVMAWRRWAPARALGGAVAFGLLVLVVACGPYVRNAVETANPLYPFAQGAFPGRNWSADADRYLAQYYRDYQATWAARRPGGKPYVHAGDVVHFPWDLTMYPGSFENSPRLAFDVSPFVLAFLPAIVLVGRRRPAAVAVAAFGAAFVAVIAIAAWAHPRYVLPGWLLLAAAAVAGADALCGRRGCVAIALATIAGSLLLATRLFGPLWTQQVGVVLGRTSPDAFLAATSPRWVFWQRANAAIPADGRVVVLEKIPHPYYIERPFALLSYLEQDLVDYRTVRTPDALAAAAHALGATHVAVDVGGLQAAGDPYEAGVTALWRAFLAREGSPVVESSGYALYALHGDEGRRS